MIPTVTDRAKYREGKLKENPERGLKENLNPDIYIRLALPIDWVLMYLLHNGLTSLFEKQKLKLEEAKA